MARPLWVAYFFAAVMVAISLYCIGRLALARRLDRRNHYDVNVAHALMGLAMVGMLVPRWNIVPDAMWEVVFVAMACYFAFVSIRFARAHGVAGTEGGHAHHISHYLIHLVMACAMLYMYSLGMPIAEPVGALGAMSGGAGDSVLTLLVVMVLIGSAVWQLDSISMPRQVALATVGAADQVGPTGGADAGADPRPWLSPRLEVGCHVAMCVTMAYMLVLMV